MKYSKNLVLDYIYGNDIECDIDELENNSNFMYDVIKISKDRKMYEFCSDELKKDYEFIKNIILLFKDDVDFIVSIADSYLKNVNIDEENINYIELMIIVNNCIKKTEDSEYVEYKIIPRICYEKDLLCISATLYDNKDNQDMIDYLEKGFIIIKDMYGESKYIMDCYAELFLLDIFDKDNLNLENVLHMHFNKIDKLKEYGIYKFLINYITSYDKTLSEYLASNIDILKVLDEKIKYILKRWDNFDKENELRRWDLINDNFYYYINDNKLEFNIDELLCHFIKKHNLEDRIFKYDLISEYDYDFIVDYCDAIFNKLNIIELKHYFELEKIFIKGFKLNIIDEVYEDLVERKEVKEKMVNKKCKIIDFNSYKNKTKN